MKLRLFSLALLAALAACQSPRVAELSYGSRLDRISVARPSSPMTPEQSDALARVRAQAEALRVRMAQEPNRVVRIDELRELQALGDQKRSLEQRPSAPRPVIRQSEEPSGGV